MTSNSTKLPVLGSDAEIAVGLLDEWFDPIEAGLRDRVRDFIQTMIESELEAVLSRRRYARRPKADPENNGAGGVAGHRHGHRSRSLLGTFGRVEIAVPRARLDTAEGKTTEWKSKALRAYQRRTKQADLLIAGAYLAGTNTRRVRRALAAVFGGAVSKDTVSRVWRKVKADWDAWDSRSLAEEPIVRLILDGTVRTTSMSATPGRAVALRRESTQSDDPRKTQGFQRNSSSRDYRHCRATILCFSSGFEDSISQINGTSFLCIPVLVPGGNHQHAEPDDLRQAMHDPSGARGSTTQFASRSAKPSRRSISRSASKPPSDDSRPPLKRATTALP